jgi:hypothetical protein
LTFCVALQAATVTVVSPTSPLPNIVKASGSTNSDAAADLADYLSRVSGRTITVNNPSATGVVIHVGNDVFVQSWAPEVANLKGDGFVLKYVSFFGEHIILAGNLERASLWAVEQFLKDYGGVRWLFPDPVYGEVVPSIPTITIDSALNEIHEPDYTSRSNFGMDNFYYPGSSYLRGRPIGSEHGQHAIQYIFNNGSYSGEIFDLHPEWFAWFNGQRNWWEYGNGWQICLANPDTVAHAVQHCIDYFIANPDSDTVSIGMNDGSGLCQDTLSQNLRNSVSPPYTDSEMSWQWVNQVAAGVAAYNGGQFANKWVEALAYSWSSTPPRFPLESNVAITKTFVLDSEIGQAEDWADPPANCQSINIYSYSWGTNFLGFRHYPTAMRDFLQWGRDTLGAVAHVTECAGDWSFDGPKYYTSQVFQWDADADPAAVMTEFCDASYGSASSEMKAFWDRLEAVWEARGPVTHGATNMRWLFYQWVGWATQCYVTPNDEFREYTFGDVTTLDNRIANAVALAAGDDAGVQYRVARMEEAWNYYRTLVLSKLNYLDVAPSTNVSFPIELTAVRALAEEIADLRYDREIYLGQMRSHPIINPRLSNSNNFQLGWMTAYTIYSNELGLLDEACTSISDYIEGTSGTAAAIQYWEAVADTDTLYEYAQTQIYMLNTPSLIDLVSNGDFESGNLLGWTPTGVTAIASGGAHQGSYSARLLSGPCYGGCSLSQTVAVAPQERYRLTVWNKNIATPPYAGVATEATIEFYSGAQVLNFGEPIRAMFRSSNPADGWTRLQSTVTVPPGADTAKISIKMKNSAEVRIDDVAFERIKDAPPITHGSLVDTFDTLLLDTARWFPASGSTGTAPPRIDTGWLLYDSPAMYDITSQGRFDELLDYSGPDRYRLRMRLSLPDGADPGSPLAFGIKSGTGTLNTSDTGFLFYNYFDLSGSGNAFFNSFRYQSGTLILQTGNNLPLTNPATDIWYTLYFDPTHLTVYASDSGYEEGPGNLVMQNAHGISNLTANGSVYFKISQSVQNIAEVLLHRPPTACGDPGTEYLDADLALDCYVDTVDLSMLASAWLDNNCSWPGWCNGADINESQKVDLVDFERFMLQWMQCSDPANGSCP